MIEIKDLTINDISANTLLNFNHHQVITKKWVNRNNNWELSDCSDVREWNEKKRIWISEYLRQQIGRGGSVVAAFDNNIFVGFCCVAGCLAGNTAGYANMTMRFVDDKWKRCGVCRKLFERICICASKMKAENCLFLQYLLLKQLRFILKWDAKTQKKLYRSMLTQIRIDFLNIL